MLSAVTVDSKYLSQDTDLPHLVLFFTSWSKFSVVFNKLAIGNYLVNKWRHFCQHKPLAWALKVCKQLHARHAVKICGRNG